MVLSAFVTSSSVKSEHLSVKLPSMNRSLVNRFLKWSERAARTTRWHGMMTLSHSSVAPAKESLVSNEAMKLKNLDFSAAAIGRKTIYVASLQKLRVPNTQILKLNMLTVLLNLNAESNGKSSFILSTRKHRYVETCNKLNQLLIGELYCSETKFVIFYNRALTAIIFTNVP